MTELLSRWMYVNVIAFIKHYLIVVIFLALIGSARSADEELTTIHIDHVMLGASNLERAVSNFEKATGVRPVFGGKHPGGETENCTCIAGSPHLPRAHSPPGRR